MLSRKKDIGRNAQTPADNTLKLNNEPDHHGATDFFA
jgi:hypothetical protein